MTRPRPRRLATLLAATLLAGLAPAVAPSPAVAITGGITPAVGNFTFLVEVNSLDGSCTGALVRPDWVLTAQHCSYPSKPDLMWVRVGNHDRGIGGQTRSVIKIVRHPDYVGGHNDLALLQLSTPVPGIRPVPIAPPSDAGRWDGVLDDPELPNLKDQGVAIGWGYIDTANTEPTALQLRLVDIRKPQPDDLGIKRIMTSGGPCGGDSGGPLLVRDAAGAWEAVGVLKAANCSTTASYSEIGAGTNRTWLINALPRPYTPFGVTDWDRDGHPDVLTRSDVDTDLWLYPGQGGRAPSALPRARIGTSWSGYTPFGVGDWDGDGNQDVIARDDTSGNLYLYPGVSSRAPSPSARVRIGNGWNGYTPYGVTDWDHDGRQDIVTKDPAGDLWLYPGDGRRAPSGQPRAQIGNGWNAMTPFGLADWDRDGHQDVLARDPAGDLWLYLGQSVRAPSTAPRVRIGNGWNGYTAFGVADWDGDGNQDIVTRDSAGTLWLYPGQSKRGGSTAAPARIGTGW